MAQRQWTRARLLAAGGSGIARFALSAPAYFVSVPVLLSLLGRQHYGIWVLITTLTGWLFLSDLGLRSLVVRETSRAIATDTISDLEAKIGQVSSLYATIIAAILGLAVVGIRPVVENVLAVPPAVVSTATVTLGLGVFAFSVDLMALGLFRGVSDGAGHVTENNLIAILYTWVRTGVILSCAWFTRDVTIMATGSVLASCAGAFAWWLTARRALPEISFRPRAFRRAELKDMIGFAGVVQINDAIAAATPQLVEAAVVRRFGLESLGLFDIGVQLSIHLRSMAYAAWFPVMPWLAARDAVDDRGTARTTTDLLVSSVSLATVLTCTVAVVGPLVVVAWVPGASPLDASLITTLATIGGITGACAPAVYAWNADARPIRSTFVLSASLLGWVLPTVIFADELMTVARWGVIAAGASVIVTLAIAITTAFEGRLSSGPAHDLGGPEVVMSVVAFGVVLIRLTFVGHGTSLAFYSTVAGAGLLALAAAGLTARRTLWGEPRAA